jgi:hypothetical protein
VKGHCYAPKGGSLRIRREGDDTSVIYRYKGLEYCKVATAYDLYIIIVKHDVCAEL